LIFFFFRDIVGQVIEKFRAGFQVGITDIWSRALAYHLLPGTNDANFFSDDQTTHGAGILYSDIAQNGQFLSKAMPYPITVINSRPPKFEDLAPGTNLPLNATVYEVRI
jgi:lysophospholipase